MQVLVCIAGRPARSERYKHEVLVKVERGSHGLERSEDETTKDI